MLHSPNDFCAPLRIEVDGTEYDCHGSPQGRGNLFAGAHLARAGR